MRGRGESSGGLQLTLRAAWGAYRWCFPGGDKEAGRCVMERKTKGKRGGDGIDFKVHGSRWRGIESGGDPTSGDVMGGRELAMTMVTSMGTLVAQ
jgi:hypothetical protein